jgi:uncharacterized protein YukE
MPEESVDGSHILVHEGLSTAGNSINGMSAAIAAELHTLKGKLAPLQQEWTESQAAGYYQDMQNEWDIAAEGLFGPDGVLGRIAHAMNVNWGNYSDAEWSNVATWRR